MNVRQSVCPSPKGFSIESVKRQISPFNQTEKHNFSSFGCDAVEWTMMEAGITLSGHEWIYECDNLRCAGQSTQTVSVYVLCVQTR